jgi:hypothetical protein
VSRSFHATFVAVTLDDTVPPVAIVVRLIRHALAEVAEPAGARPRYDTFETVSLRRV